MAKKREADYGEDNKVTTRNDFIKAYYPKGVTTADLKLMRLVISQCRKYDTEFYEYQFNIMDVAERFGMDKSNLYREAHDLAVRLFQCFIEIPSGGKKKWRHVFEQAEYSSGIFTMQLKEDMRDLFLGLKRGNFTSIPLLPILAMKKKNSIRLYELICQKFMSHYPYAGNATVITISLEELREITETVKKSYDHTGHLKNKTLKPALAEIEAAADWKIIVRDLKRSRRIIGFELTVWSRNGYEYIEQCKREGRIPSRSKMSEDEDKPLEGQMTLTDYLAMDPGEGGR